MIFTDREEAGRKLAEVLKKYRGQKDVIVVALPRGGVVTGRVIADALSVPLDLVVPRKIGAPFNEEYAIGALTETGETIWNEQERERVDQKVLDQIIEKELREAKRRLRVYRRGLPPRNLKGKTVILVDDGVATGNTMRAAIKTARAEKPGKLIVAVPGGSEDVIEQLRTEIDEVIVLTNEFVGAVGNLYQTFPQVEDAEVIKLMRLPA